LLILFIKMPGGGDYIYGGFMLHKDLIRVCMALGLVGAFLLLVTIQAEARLIAQIPTVSIPTVTGTPSGATATVSNEFDQINVRSGPSSLDYPIIGVLIAGQKVPALGRTPGDLWIQIAYPGVPGGIAWVYAPNVKVEGSLPIVDAPPTPTPRVTPTIDPTLAAQFIIEIPPTRLPTFTAPPPLVIPTLIPDSSPGQGGRVPVGLIVVGLAVMGIFGTLISFLRGR
jgi:hypothetical protein